MTALLDGTTTVDEALAQLQGEQRLGYATVDSARRLRTGHPEAIYGEGKTVDQLVGILTTVRASGQIAIATRVDREKAEAVCARVEGLVWHQGARVLQTPAEIAPDPRRGTIAVVCAGTSDLPVADEAEVVARAYGNPVQRFTDVGVAGIHRILGRVEELRTANVVIVVAGMEGALASVVAGLVDRPVIAVPTSVGYGAHFGGLAALLGMLNSCASGVSVVNIDNGYGAAVQASLINALAAREPAS